MTLAIVFCRASAGIFSPLVTVETHISSGFPSLNIVGLPETAVKESKDRVRSALMTSGYEFPRRRITVNLAPADLPKEGGRFDLAIALGILAATRQVPMDRLPLYEWLGELALSGELRPVNGVLPAVLAAQQAQRCLIIPAGNAEEAALVKNAAVLAAAHLLEACAFLKGERELSLDCSASRPAARSQPALDLADVAGQAPAKRALEIAAVGKHSLLFMGPPGTGKTMLAARLPTILPALSEEEALETAAVTSLSTAGFQPSRWQQLPFRAPHHTASSVALVGGGRPPRPGEISLAHHGVLFLDELPEFNRTVLESLREPLESGVITISRASFQTVFPARFQLIAAMNPCPCGYAGRPEQDCQCSPEQVQRYLSKLSGPLMDRVDLQVEVPALPADVLARAGQEPTETSQQVLERVSRARELQYHRQGKCNADLAVSELKAVCLLARDAHLLLHKVMEKFQFSARIYHRLLKVARTIADLNERPELGVEEVSEALLYRCLDKQKNLVRTGYSGSR